MGADLSNEKVNYRINLHLSLKPSIEKAENQNQSKSKSFIKNHKTMHMGPSRSYLRTGGWTR